MRPGVDVVPCCSNHFREIVLQESQSDTDFGDELNEDHDAILAVWGRTIVADGKVVACVGVTPKHPGVGEAWGLFAPEISGPLGFSIARIVVENLAALVKRKEFRRIQATCVAKDEREGAFLEALGFDRQAGELEAYGVDGRAHAMYSLVRRD
jgi:hypothetical protein